MGMCTPLVLVKEWIPLEWVYLTKDDDGELQRENL